MEKIKKLCEIIEHELNKIAEKGLTTSNLETAYKLVDMYKDIKNTEYWETKGDYYNHVLREMGGDYGSEDYSMRGRKRDRMGRYSRDDGMMMDDRYRRTGRTGYSMNEGAYSMYDKYIDSKQSYRNEKSQDSKQRLMDSLEDYMDDFAEKIKEISRDSDFPEERELVNKLLNKLQNIR